MSDGQCQVRGGTLVAAGDFSLDADTHFDEACRKLLLSPERELLADLRGVNILSSTYVGLLAELGLGARTAGRQLKVRARPRIAALLREAGLGTVAIIEDAK
jgi:anti-anti-sigma regulatory factor